MYIKYLSLIPVSFKLPSFGPGALGSSTNRMIMARGVFYIIRVIYFVHLNGVAYGIAKVFIVVFFASIGRLLPTSLSELMTEFATGVSSENPGASGSGPS
jgi:hypothetical protein